MTDSILVKPRPGLILAEVPSGGIELPRALAEEWLADRMVVRVLQSPAPVGKSTNTAVRARKQRRTRGK